MLRGLRRRITYADVMATIAVFIALGGVSYAAVTLPKNSVGNAQLRKNAVTGLKVRNSSLTGGDIRNRSLTAADFKGSVQGPQGPAGPPGAAGAKGDTGPAGATNVVVRRKGLGALPAGQFTNGVAVCQTGERATGGGGGFDGNGGNEIIQQSFPALASGDAVPDGATPVAWRVFMKNANAFQLANASIYVVCTRP